MMPLADQIERQIRAERESRFCELQLPAEFIAPNYRGRSIVNVPSSIVQVFGGQMHTAPLHPTVMRALTTGVKRVVLIVIDALGYQRLLDALSANAHNGFHTLLRNGGQLVPLTSVFPSTTTAALTALWSGYTPAEHGFMGFQLFLRGYNVRAQMIGFNPVATDRLGDEQLLAAGLEPESFVPVPSLPQTLEKFDVAVYNLIEQPYVKSALSRVQIRGTREMRGFVTSSDLWVVLRAWLEQHRWERALFVGYWSAIDSISHTYGPASHAVIAEVDNLAYSFEREFLRPLSAGAREGTLFLLTADHGQLDTPINRTVYLRDHPELRSHMLMDFTGEPRAAYLYCVTGEVAAARAYIESQLGQKFFVLDSQSALKAGLFGSGKIASEARYRIGDLIVLPRENYILWDRTDAPHTLGRHGGLAVQEMLVPFMAARLDG